MNGVVLFVSFSWIVELNYVANENENLNDRNKGSNNVYRSLVRTKNHSLNHKFTQVTCQFNKKVKFEACSCECIG